MRRGLLVGTVLMMLAAVAPLARGAETCARPAWPMYGRDLSRSFSQDPGCTSITAGNAQTLVPKWVVRAKDSVTASPTVVDGRVYVGAWDGTFYALDAETGDELWTFEVDDPEQVGFGRIVSSAAVARFRDSRGRSRKVVVFGGGATLYALDAVTGAKLASADLDPRTPELQQAQEADPPDVQIESSPAVVGDRIYVGMDVHNAAATGRTGLVSLRLRARGQRGWVLEPSWKFDPETERVYYGRAGLTEGSGQGFGCGGVWSSPTIDTANNLVFFGTANCNNVEDARAAGEGWAETMWAIRADDGAPVWSYRPAADPDQFATVEEQNAEAHADDDFGASPNLFTLDDGRSLVGEGRKSAHYYARDPRSGAEAWTVEAGQSGRVDFNFSVGGFLGTTAVQKDVAGRALRIIGTTAIPVPKTPDQPGFVGSVERSMWSVRALDPATGRIDWVWQLAGPSYGAPTVANGVVFVPDTFSDTLMLLDAETGRLITARPLIGPSSSAPAVVGDSVYLGAGTRETDAEYKAIRDAGVDTQALASAIGPHPLSPLSGIMAFRLAG